MSDMLLTNTIQGVGILILVLSLAGCLLLRNTLKTGRCFCSRSLNEIFLAQRANEIVERNRIQKAKDENGWNGIRKFKVSKKVIEAKDQCSFLYTHDGRKLPPFDPGQFLTFSLNIPDQAKPVIRCYSLLTHLKMITTVAQ